MTIFGKDCIKNFTYEGKNVEIIMVSKFDDKRKGDSYFSTYETVVDGKVLAESDDLYKAVQFVTAANN